MEMVHIRAELIVLRTQCRRNYTLDLAAPTAAGKVIAVRF